MTILAWIGHIAIISLAFVLIGVTILSVADVIQPAVPPPIVPSTPPGSPAWCLVKGNGTKVFDLSKIPAPRLLQVSQNDEGLTQWYQWSFDLCRIANTPPPGSNASCADLVKNDPLAAADLRGAGYIQQYVTPGTGGFPGGYMPCVAVWNQPSQPEWKWNATISAVQATFLGVQGDRTAIVTVSCDQRPQPSANLTLASPQGSTTTEGFQVDGRNPPLTYYMHLQSQLLC